MRTEAGQSGGWGCGLLRLHWISKEMGSVRPAYANNCSHYLLNRACVQIKILFYAAGPLNHNTPAVCTHPYGGALLHSRSLTG